MNKLVDLLFLAKDRLHFTSESLSALLRNTDTLLLNNFHVYDDNSTDGTGRYLKNLCSGLGLSFYQTRIGSPVSLFNSFIQNTTACGAEFIAKIDNDCVVSPSWLPICLQVLDDNPELQCLGIEPFTPINSSPSIKRGHLPCQYTGGIGVFRRSAFVSLPQPDRCYFGLGKWQQENNIKCGWLDPALPVFLLDHLPFEPWLSLSKEYVKKGWQRESWGVYRKDLKRVEGFHAHGPELWEWRFPNWREAKR